MTLIDKNSAVIPEGDYIAMCAALKQLYEGRKISTESLLDDALTEVVLKIKRLRVRRDAFTHWPVLTDDIKLRALTEYAIVHRLDSLRDFTEEGFVEAGLDVDFPRLYAGFMTRHDVRRERIDEDIRAHETLRNDIMRRMVT